MGNDEGLIKSKSFDWCYDWRIGVTNVVLSHLSVNACCLLQIWRIGVRISVLRHVLIGVLVLRDSCHMKYQSISLAYCCWKPES